MDLSTITDIKELKALAYDQIAEKENAERNLAVINERIRELNSISENTISDEAPSSKDNNGGE